jgi:hypothetical protein
MSWNAGPMSLSSCSVGLVIGIRPSSISKSERQPSQVLNQPPLASEGVLGRQIVCK